MNISDWTSNRLVTIFAEDAEKLLGNLEMILNKMLL